MIINSDKDKLLKITNTRATFDNIELKRKLKETIINNTVKSITVNELQDYNYLEFIILHNNTTNKTSYMKMIINDDTINNHYKVRMYSSSKNYPYIYRSYKNEYTFVKINLMLSSNKIHAMSCYGGLHNTTKIVYYEYLEEINNIDNVTFLSQYNINVFGINSQIILSWR